MKHNKLEEMISKVGNKVRENWFSKKFTEFGSLADKNGYVIFKPEIIGTSKFNEEKQIKWEKMLEHQLYMANKKMNRPNGRLKGFWI